MTLTIKNNVNIKGKVTFSLPPAVPQPDPLWSEVGLLFHFDEVDGSNTHLNSSNGERMLFASDSRIVTNQKKFGVSSAYFGGATGWEDYFKNTSPTTNNWYKNRVDGIKLIHWTWECWAMIESLTGDIMACIALDPNNNNDYNYLGFSADGKPRYAQGFGGLTLLESATSIPVGEWVHLAVSVEIPNARLYVNGIEKASTTSMSELRTNTQPDGYIGVSKAASWGWNKPFRGWIDEVRYTGADRYTENFTPSTVPFMDE